MEIKVCPVCNAQISAEIPKCPYCQYLFPNQTYDVSGIDTKDKVLSELERTNTNIMRLDEDIQELNNDQSDIYNKYLKRIQLVLIITTIVSIIGLIILPIVFNIIGGNIGTLGSVIGIISFFVLVIGTSIWVVILPQLRKIELYKLQKALADKHASVSKFKTKQMALIDLLKQFVIAELCQQFNISQYQIEYDLTPILNQHPELHEWWTNKEKIDVVVEALVRKYKRTYNELEKSDLEVENLKLQNESISIDNNQKKNWRCGSCGNLNRADDMSCINCGAIRPVMEE